MCLCKQSAAEMKVLKNRLKKTWTAGNFVKIAVITEKAAAEFVGRLDLIPEMKVLDVACGTGNQSIPAAQAGAKVTGIDIAPNLLAQVRSKAADKGLPIRFDEGDAERLPYDDQSFDHVISMFGAMFAPRWDKVVIELLRVCRAGGSISMANWTAAGFVGQMFKITGKHVSTSPSLAPSSPFQWGEAAWVRSYFGDAIFDLQCERRFVELSFPFGVRETIEYWRKYYGPARKAFATLDRQGKANLLRDLERLWTENNTSSDGITSVKAEYLEVRAVKRERKNVQVLAFGGRKSGAARVFDFKFCSMKTKPVAGCKFKSPQTVAALTKM